MTSGIYNRAEAVTKSDAADIPGGLTDALYVGTGGTMTVVFQDDSTCAMTVAAGLLPIRVKRVNNTGTAAAITALYLTP